MFLEKKYLIKATALSLLIGLCSLQAGKAKAKLGQRQQNINEFLDNQNSVSLDTGKFIVAQNWEGISVWDSVPNVGPILGPTPVIPDLQYIYIDVTRNHWAHQPIQELVLRGIMTGYSSGQFRPDSPVTRAEFAAIISQAFQQPIVREPLSFSDVSSDHWGRQAITEAYTTGFLSGYGNGQFRPDQNIQRAEMLVSLVSGLQYRPYGDPNEIVAIYQDADEIPAWMAENIAAATEREMLARGSDVQALYPNRPATRAEVAAIVYKVLTEREQPHYIDDQDPFSWWKKLQNLGISANAVKARILAGEEFSPDIAVPELIDIIQDIHQKQEGSSVLVCFGPNGNEPCRSLSEEELNELSEEELNKNEIPKISYLSDQEWIVLELALNALTKLEIDGAIALRDLLKSDEQLLVEAATYGLGQMGSVSEIAIPDLIEISKNNESPVVRANSIRALAKIDFYSASVSSAIAHSLLNDESTNVQLAAIEAIKGNSSFDYLPTINSALIETFINHENFEIRINIIDILVENPPQNINSETVQFLVQNFEHLHFPIMNPADYCYRSIDDVVIAQVLSSPSSLRMLSNILENSSLDIRLKAMRIISIGAAKNITGYNSLLLAALENDSVDIRIEAASILIDLQGKTDKVTAILTPMLQHNREDIRNRALMLLGGTGSYEVVREYSLRTCATSASSFSTAFRRRWPW